MKTIREHLNELPEPYRAEALENEPNDSWWDEIEEETQSDALNGGFVWGVTPQGHDYWSRLDSTL